MLTFFAFFCRFGNIFQTLDLSASCHTFFVATQASHDYSPSDDTALVDQKIDNTTFDKEELPAQGDHEIELIPYSTG